MKAIKLWADGPEEARNILNYLYACGYNWNIEEPTLIENNKAFFGHSTGLIGYIFNDRAYFDYHMNTQVWISKITTENIGYSPEVGSLKPRKIHEDGRMLDILEAMQAYVKEGKLIPMDWLDEFWENVRAEGRL